MNIMENKIYFTYIVFGSLYFISKLIYYIFGWVCFAGLMLGLVASVLRILIGIASFNEYKKAGWEFLYSDFLVRRCPYF